MKPKSCAILSGIIKPSFLSIPILFGWISIYAADYIPGFSQNPLPYAIGGDLLLLVSLFVLGGNFWDKIRGLFVYDAEVHFSQK